MKGGGEYRVGQRKSRGRQPFMIGMEEPTQWKKRWESIIREDNAIICTCLWTTLNTTNCSFSIIIPPLPFPFSNFHAPFHLHFSSTFQSASTYRTNALHLCFQSLISCQFWLSLSFSFSFSFSFFHFSFSLKQWWTWLFLFFPFEKLETGRYVVKEQICINVYNFVMILKNNRCMHIKYHI